MKYLILFLLLSGCQGAKYRVGQKVRTKDCTGVITSTYYDWPGQHKYQLHALDCGEYSLTRGSFFEEEIME